MSKIYLIIALFISSLLIYISFLKNQNDNLTNELNHEKLSNELLQESNDSLQSNIDMLSNLQVELNDIEYRYQELSKVLKEGERLKRLSEGGGKPKLIERKVNNATEQIFKSIACNSDINNSNGLCDTK